MDIKSKLAEFLIDDLSISTAGTLAGDTDLMKAGLTSLGFVRLVAYVESLREQRIPEGDLAYEFFTNIDTILGKYFPAR